MPQDQLLEVGSGEDGRALQTEPQRTRPFTQTTRTAKRSHVSHLPGG